MLFLLLRSGGDAAKIFLTCFHFSARPPPSLKNLQIIPLFAKICFSFSGNLAQILIHLVLFKNNDTMEKRSVEWLPTWSSKYFSSSAKVSSFLSICSSVCFNLFISMIKAFLPKLKKESDPEPPVFHFLKKIKIKKNQY